MSDLQSVFFEAFDGLERLAPGSESSTLRALSVVRTYIGPRRIVDAGCGAGAQTMVLARHTSAQIVAVDTHAPYLRALETRVAEAGFADRVRTLDASMDGLSGRIEAGSVDVIWSEGSIYTIGFDRGLSLWRELLRDAGVIACSEAAWLVSGPSEAARRFWNEGYPQIRGVQDNIDAAQAAGYACMDHFVLPASDWLDEYYAPLETRVSKLKEKYARDAEARGVLDSIDVEIDMYRRAGHEYGYVFYVLRRV